MKGVWLDGKATCLAKRTLRVSIRSTSSRRRARQRGSREPYRHGRQLRGRRTELGFDLKPRAYRMACATAAGSPGATRCRSRRRTCARG